MAWIFWTSVAWVVYAYAGYGLVLRAVVLLRRRPVVRANVVPRVSIVVAVHNGASEIRAKLENVLAQDYPQERREVLVADDASTDGTDEIIRTEFLSRGVRLVRETQRGGKERVQRAAVAAATGDVLIFTDVGTLMDPDGLGKLVRAFADPTVGAVSSVDRFLDQHGRPAPERRYVQYEMRLRALESEVGSLVGLSGSLFAARREVCSDFSERLTSDFRTALAAVRKGYRAVVELEAYGYYKDIRSDGAEFGRKVRTVIRGLTVVFAEADLLNPFRYGLFSWQLLSHKIARWTVPFALATAFGASLWLAAGSRFFRIVLGLQLACYLSAIVFEMIPGLARNSVGRILRYWVQANVAILIGWFRYVCGTRIVSWTPSAR